MSNWAEVIGAAVFFVAWGVFALHHYREIAWRDALIAKLEDKPWRG